MNQESSNPVQQALQTVTLFPAHQYFTPLQVKYFASTYLRSTLTDCQNVHIHCISQYLHMPINMWHIWGKYTYKGKEFDSMFDIWQNKKQLEVCQSTEVWSN